MYKLNFKSYKKKVERELVLHKSQLYTLFCCLLERFQGNFLECSFYSQKFCLRLDQVPFIQCSIFTGGVPLKA